MSGLEVNKILAAIIMAVLIVFLISNIGDFLVNPNEDQILKLPIMLKTQKKIQQKKIKILQK